MPDIKINATTWTRESHGLFDFEGVEIERKTFKVRGNLRITRDESDVQIVPTDKDNFYEQERNMAEEYKDKIVARILSFNQNYWIYHKNYVDSNID